MTNAEASADLATRALTAYESFASFYDDFTGRHDFDAWTESLERIALASGGSRGRLLDVGCGTGKSFAPMLERGWRITAVDQSPAMLRGAETRAAGGVELLRHDVRDLPKLGDFDLVWSLGDLVNYLEPSELRQVLERLGACLAPDGVLLFDAMTVGTLAALERSAIVERTGEDVLVLDGRGWIDDEQRVAEVWIDRFLARDDDCWRRERTVLLHRYHPAAEVTSAIVESRLELVGVWGNRSDGAMFEELDEQRDAKAIYVARRR